MIDTKVRRSMVPDRTGATFLAQSTGLADIRPLIGPDVPRAPDLGSTSVAPSATASSPGVRAAPARFEALITARFREGDRAN